MKKYGFILSLILMLVSLHCDAALFAKRPLENDITDAILIFKGVLKRKYTKFETVTSQFTKVNGTITEKPYNKILTTYVFQVDDVLKGYYENNEIEVKMLGGCIKDNCSHTSFSYEYVLDEEAIIFLNYISNTQLYKSGQSSSTAFGFNDNGHLYRKSSPKNKKEPIYISKNKRGKENILSD